MDRSQTSSRNRQQTKPKQGLFKGVEPLTVALAGKV
jgi:hypothetical protein